MFDDQRYVQFVGLSLHNYTVALCNCFCSRNCLGDMLWLIIDAEVTHVRVTDVKFELSHELV